MQDKEHLRDDEDRENFEQDDEESVEFEEEDEDE